MNFLHKNCYKAAAAMAAAIMLCSSVPVYAGAADAVLQTEAEGPFRNLASDQLQTLSDKARSALQEAGFEVSGDLGVVRTDEDTVSVIGDADEAGSLVGRLKDKDVVQVLAEDNGYIRITSGNVTGYVSEEDLVVDDVTAIEEALQVIATVTGDSVCVRSAASADGERIGSVNTGDTFAVTDPSADGWIGITYYNNAQGYVSADYAELSYSYSCGETLEEEQARLEEEEKAGSGEGVIEYALQFVGNPYVWGGTSLTEGTDCSGFTMSVYSHFGITLPHSSRAQRSCGYAVSLDQVQAGDIICYEGHVALYIGDGQIVHAANSQAGIIVSDMYYRTPICARRILSTEN